MHGPRRKTGFSTAPWLGCARHVGNVAQEGHRKTGKITAELAKTCMMTKRKSVKFEEVGMLLSRWAARLITHTIGISGHIAYNDIF